MTKRPKLVAINNGGEVKNGELTASTMENFYNEVSTDVLARTIWGEARGEGDQGMHAVACVVMNRVKVAQDHGKFWWGNNVIQVCQKPYQFSCWNRSDPNFRKLQEVDVKDPYFVTALRISKRAHIDALKDITGGATHYHSIDVKPYWARENEPCSEVGNHLFYKLA